VPEAKRVVLKFNAGVVETPVYPIGVMAHSPEGVPEGDTVEHLLDAHAGASGIVCIGMGFLMAVTLRDQ
jgi:hypothetical protein